MKLDYNAPAAGVLARLVGARESLAIRVGGAGRYTDWKGRAQADQGTRRIADLALANRAGRYTIAGPVRPGSLLTGLPVRVAGPEVALQASGTLVRSVLSGTLHATGSGADLAADGTIDLGHNAFQRLHLVADSRDPAVLGSGTRLENARLDATLDGPFRALSADHRLTIGRLAAGTVSVERVVQQGRLTRRDDGWALPVNLTTGRLRTGNATLDPQLTSGHARGTIELAGTRLASHDLVVGVPGIGAALNLTGDTRQGDYRLAGPVAARGLALANIGTADADLALDAKFGAHPWLVDAGVRGG